MQAWLPISILRTKGMSLDARNGDCMKILVVFGTRPEAIKMIPIFRGFQNREGVSCKLLVSAQHRQMLDQILETFDVKPDYDLDIMKTNQTLTDIFTGVLEGVDRVIKDFHPDLVLVHGDTSTTFAASLSAFYNQVKVGHIEAGLRSYNKYSPFPEEMNRSLVGRIADMHFAPTEQNKENLLAENVREEDIFVVGNTVIDALKSVVRPDFEFSDNLISILKKDTRKILFTAHRRENMDVLDQIFLAIKDLADLYKDIDIIYPIHLNPKIREIYSKIVGEHDRIHLIEPLEYREFSNLMARSFIVISDSGGVQEEAPALDIPVLVLRRETERQEGVVAGTIKLVGVEREHIVKEASLLLENADVYEKMAKSVNPYGAGDTAERIIDIILNRSNKI